MNGAASTDEQSGLEELDDLLDDNGDSSESSDDFDDGGERTDVNKDTTIQDKLAAGDGVGVTTNWFRKIKVIDCVK